MTTDEDLLAASPSRAPGTELHWRDDGARRTPILKDRMRGRYHRLSTGSAWIWSLCDGRRTLAAIAASVAAKGGPPDAAVVIAAALRLAADGLVEGVAVEAPPPDERGRGFAAACLRILTWRLTIHCVDPLMTWLYHHVGFLAFKRPVRILLILLMAAGAAAFLATWLFWQRPFADLAGRWVWLLPLFLFGCILPHEAAHAMANKHFGREVIGAGFGWFWLGPFFYIDTSDMWLAGRRERILVSLAGTVSDLSIAGACSLVACFATPPLSAAAFAAATALYLIVLGNLSPLLEYDGYYVLADLLDRPNLRRRSLRRLCGVLSQRPIRWREFSRDRIEFAYGVGSLAYLAFLLGVSAYFNHAFFDGLLGAATGWWTAALTWLATLALLLVFLCGLVSDIRRSGHPPSPLARGR